MKEVSPRPYVTRIISVIFQIILIGDFSQFYSGQPKAAEAIFPDFPLDTPSSKEYV